MRGLPRNGYCHPCKFVGTETELTDHLEANHSREMADRKWLKDNIEVRYEPFRPDDKLWIKRNYGKPVAVGVI